MFKNIKQYSVVALATLVIIGCGGNNDNSNNKSSKTDLNSYSAAEKLAYYIANQDKTTQTGNSKKKRSREVKECQNSGSMDFGSVSNEDFLNKPVTIVFNHCDDGYGTTHGTLQMNMDDNDEGTMNYLTDFTFKDGSDKGLIKKGGSVETHHDGEWEVATINMVVVFNGITHGGENLVYRSKELPNGESEEYPVSGKEKIGDSAYFTVDPSYDASATPFKTNANDELISGLFKYIDDKNHAVEFEVVGKNKIAVRVNENGDGTFSNDEKSIIDLAR